MPIAIANLLFALATVLQMIINAYMLIIIIRALITWVNPDPYNPIVIFLYKATEPVLKRARKIIPPIGGIDLSPIVVLLALVFAREFIVQTLLDFARGIH